MSYLGGAFRVSMWNKLYEVDMLRRSGIRCVGRQTVEDNWFTFQLLLSIGSYAIIPELTYIYNAENVGSTTVSGWSGSIIATQWESITVDTLRLACSASLCRSLRISVKERLFRQRIGLSELSLLHDREPCVHIHKYSSISHLLDVDSFRSGVLLLGLF
jgi:hypothetical protein